MKSHAFGLTLLSLAAIFASVSAQAQNGSLTHSFVSSSGVDTNLCTLTAPCASFAQAYTKIGENGIITALDPGKYGPLTNITTGVTINGNGWAAITAPANGTGITINASAGNGDSVSLIGLAIDGGGWAYSGIVFNSGASLTIDNCTVQNLNDDETEGLGNLGGIVIQPKSGSSLTPFDFVIANTTVSNNAFAAGIYYIPSQGVTSNGIIDHVVATNNGEGAITIDNSAGGASTIAVLNSVAVG